MGTVPAYISKIRVHERIDVSEPGYRQQWLSKQRLTYARNGDESSICIQQYCIVCMASLHMKSCFRKSFRQAT